MPNLIDLSIPVRHGDGRLGLEVAFSTPYSFETCGWQGSSFAMFAHYAPMSTRPTISSRVRMASTPRRSPG
jgi:hypothetical protein